MSTAGNRDIAAKLVEALDVAPAPEPRGGSEVGRDDPDRRHVHGFHTYPARMHPSTAGRLVDSLTAPGATVLDPFCGSGTVLVEAMVAGRSAIGVDLNPLAVRLARVKTGRPPPHEREAMLARARAIAGFADERRARRAGATRRYPPEDVALFDPHVLLELDSIRAGIAAEPEAVAREGLEMVLSAILVKLSRRASDTSRGVTARRIAAGYPARLFVKKTEELVRRLGAFEAVLPSGGSPAKVQIDDATRLQNVPAATIDAAVTSPPYVGTYDYLSHHALRMRWLNLDPQPLAAHEMGARRRYAPLGPALARDAWQRELGAALRALSRACRKGGVVALVLADSAVGAEALRMDELVPPLAAQAGFALLARASQTRPHFHGPTAAAFARTARAEHAMALEKR